MKSLGVLAMSVLLLNSTISNANPIHEAHLAGMIQSVATLADLGNFETLEKRFAAEVQVDYTSAFGGEVELKSPPALMTQWASVLPGFDVTRHSLSNIQVTVTDNEAEGTAEVVADHYLDGVVWRITGSYVYRFAHNDDQWEITHMTFKAGPETGSRELIDKAVERAAQNPASYILRQQTVQTVHDFLDALEEKDMIKFANVWAEDAVQDMPYSPQGFPKRVSGKANLLEHYSAWPEISGDANFTDHLVVYPLQVPDMVFVEYRGAVQVIPTGRQYNQVYGGLFHVENSKITLFREYYDPEPFKYAFGLDEGGAFDETERY
jgi:ketosteroid isomerase-like protein